jgi:SAM-dependent methyltransferase
VPTSSSRLRRLREDPLEALVFDLDWSGTRVLGRVGAAGAAPRWRSALYRGDRVSCPVCARGFRRFAPDALGRPVLCPSCGSQERHRALWLFLDGRERPLAGVERLLHLAPEPGILERLGARGELAEYVTADLDSPFAADRVDVQALPYEDGRFGALICSHVLEHVDDDRRAMGELLRVLRPGGTAWVMVPVDAGRETTREDPSVASAEARRAAFWQEDHVRLYGRDFARRLEAAGFAVETRPLAAEHGPAAARRFGLSALDDLFVARRPA